MKRSLLVVAALTTAVWIPNPVGAKSLRDSLIPPGLNEPGSPLTGALQPLGSAIGSQVANQIPALSTSAGYTYEWNPELEVLERSAKTFGPLFTERAVTLGRNKFNLNASYTYIKFATFNGQNLDKMTNRIEKAFVPETGQTEYFGLFRGFDCDEAGNCNHFAGDRVRLNLDIEAQLFDLSFTYGLLDHLDVNIDVPVLRTYLRSAVQETLPDPRCLDTSADCQLLLDPQFGGDNNGFFIPPEQVSRADSLGIGDIHLRAKWAPIANPVHLAGLLDLALPTGDVADFQGTGDTRIGTIFIASKDIFSFLEFHTQGGIEFNVNDVDISQGRYAGGFTAQVASFMAVTVDFLGRSEFSAQKRIPNSGRLPAVRNIDGVDTLTQPRGELTNNDNFKGRPIFVDIKRNDVLDLAVGGRFAIGDHAMILANFLVPLNQDGLRADFIPTLAIETNF
jgi:hypothetical protein